MTTHPKGCPTTDGGPEYAPRQTVRGANHPVSPVRPDDAPISGAIRVNPTTRQNHPNGGNNPGGGATDTGHPGLAGAMQRSKPRAVWPAIEEWRLAQTAQGLAARTVTERCRVAQQLADGTGDPLTVSTRQVRAWVAVQDVSQSTRCTYDRYLRAFFRFLVEDDLRQDDPLAKAKRVRDPRREARPVKDEHLELLLASRMHHRTRVMILLCAFQGLRVHEVAKIRGEDVDLTAGLLFVEGKGGVTASLPLHELVAAEAQRMPRRGWWFPAYEAQGRAGAHVHGNTVSTVISQAMRRCGIVGGTAHKLRHWYGTSLVAGGTNLRATQELLRHASLQTTQQYVRVQAQDMTEGIARLGADLQVPRLRRRPGRGAA